MKKYTTEQKIASAKKAIKALLSIKSDLCENHLHELLKICHWKLTLALCPTKYETRYCSKTVHGYFKKLKQEKQKIENVQLHQNKKIAKEKTKILKKEILKKICHEHVFETKTFISDLLADNNQRNFDMICEEASVACAITRKEHVLLGRVDKTLRGWERYKAAKIKTVDLESE